MIHSILNQFIWMSGEIGVWDDIEFAIYGMHINYTWTMYARAVSGTVCRFTLRTLKSGEYAKVHVAQFSDCCMMITWPRKEVKISTSFRLKLNQSGNCLLRLTFQANECNIYRTQGFLYFSHLCELLFNPVTYFCSFNNISLDFGFHRIICTYLY